MLLALQGTFDTPIPPRSAPLYVGILPVCEALDAMDILFGLLSFGWGNSGSKLAVGQ